MNPIFNSLQQGYDPEEILGFLSKSLPQIVPSIRKARSAGYTIQQILGFLSKTFDKPIHKGMSESEIHAANRISDSERGKFGLKMAGAAFAAPIVGNAARSALSRALPSSIQTLLPGIEHSDNIQNPSVQNQNEVALEQTSQKPQQIVPSENISQQPPVNAENITQTSKSVQPEVKTINAGEVLTNASKTYNGLKEKIDELVKSGNGAEQISAFFQKFRPEIVKNIEKSSGQTFKKTIEDYLSQSTNLLPKSTELVGKETKNAGNPQIQEKISPEMEKPTISKKETVFSPQGIGEVKEIRNGQALIDVDGKMHKVKESELVPSPLPQKDLADIYDELLRGIEKETGQEVSRNVNVAAYDPEANSLAYIPHQGGLYIYDDISDEDKAILMNSLATRKTTGSNHIGAWKEGTVSPMGAQMSALIKKLQSERGGKGKEYARKYEMIYRALAPAEEAHREKKRKKK